MRVQFFLDGPFDPIETLSAELLDDELHPVETIVLGGSHAQYELWSLIATMAADMVSRHGTQDELPELGEQTTGR